jgi:hypothetical protein
MATAAEYRAWAEESLRWARDAMTESTRDAYIKFALFWLESASRGERLSPQRKPHDQERSGIEFRSAPISLQHASAKRAAPIPHGREHRRGLH